VATILAYLAPACAAPSTAVGTYPSIRDYLGAVAGDDPKLVVLFTEAATWADTILGSKDLSAAQLNLVTSALYRYMRVAWDENKRGSVVARKIKTGGREEEYTGAEAGRIDAAKLVAWASISAVCDDPTLFASGGGW
jgi:hypothetical protein